MKSFFADADMGLVGLLFFFVFFCLMTVWTMRPSAKSKYKEHGNIPLQENDK